MGRGEQFDDVKIPCLRHRDCLGFFRDDDFRLMRPKLAVKIANKPGKATT
jgi:hypothetical protein